MYELDMYVTAKSTLLGSANACVAGHTHTHTHTHTHAPALIYTRTGALGLTAQTEAEGRRDGCVDPVGSVPQDARSVPYVAETPAVALRIRHGHD